MRELAAGSILAVAFGKEYAQEVVVGYRCGCVSPVVSPVLWRIVDVSWIGELFQVFLGGSPASVVSGPRARHVRVWFGVVVILGVKLRWIRDVLKRVVII